MSSLHPVGRSAAALDVGRFAATLDQDRVSACRFTFADGPPLPKLRVRRPPRPGRGVSAPLCDNRFPRVLRALGFCVLTSFPNPFKCNTYKPPHKC
jgi:hypothetical protein